MRVLTNKEDWEAWEQQTKDHLNVEAWQYLKIKISKQHEFKLLNFMFSYRKKAKTETYLILNKLIILSKIELY